MNSRLYECHVMHERFSPKSHRFLYRLFLFAIDLDELDFLHRKLALFSVNRRNLYSFRDADFLPTGEALHNSTLAVSSAAPAETATRPTGSASPTGASLKQRVIDHLATHDIHLGPGGRVELVTLPRVAGYLFNPVSFYFCYDASGACVASLAEVTNTFREMKPYVLGPGARNAQEPVPAAAFHLRVPKHFYVSPYSDVDVAFDFTLRVPGDRLSIQIDDYAGERRTLTSTLGGPRAALTNASLAWFTLKYPLITLRIIALIHWHALRLYVKRVPWFSKASRAADQRALYRPHVSIAHAKPSDA